jgi:large subunit ribosomal protein L19e
MTHLKSQKRLAASILKCGVNRVWIDDSQISDIEKAISREEIRELIENGTIAAHQKKGVSRGRARARMVKRAYGHCNGPGRRRGTAGARNPSKRRWIQKIRAQRKILREMRETGVIDRSVYRTFYRKAAGGQFRTVAHLKAQIDIGREK